MRFVEGFVYAPIYVYVDSTEASHEGDNARSLIKTFLRVVIHVLSSSGVVSTYLPSPRTGIPSDAHRCATAAG